MNHAGLAEVETCLYFGSRSRWFLEKKKKRAPLTCSASQITAGQVMLFCLHDTNKFFLNTFEVAG